MTNLQKIILKEKSIIPGKPFKIISKTDSFKSGVYLINDDMHVFKIDNLNLKISQDIAKFIIDLIYDKIIVIKKLTEDEMITLTALKINNYNFIARDKNNSLYAFQNKPNRESKIWSANYPYFKIKSELFINIDWKDEPVSIENLLKDYVKNK